MILLAFIFALLSAPSGPPVHEAAIGRGVTLHYVDVGRGAPIVLVHGSISDYEYWAGPGNALARNYRIIAYSRRYNWPNRNAPVRGYSAITDADDLAAFMRAIHLKKAVIFGHSYGALTALFFAAKYPHMVTSLVLAEPPAVSLLPESRQREIQQHLVRPMVRDFSAGRSQAGVADFVDYVYANPHKWSEMDAQSKRMTMRDAGEWNVMMTEGTLFPTLTPAEVESIHVPALLISGTKTYPFLTTITRKLGELLPDSQTLWVRGAGHQMLYDRPAQCMTAIDAFLARTARGR